MSSPISCGGCSIDGPPREFERGERHRDRAVDAGDRVKFVNTRRVWKCGSASASAIVRTRAAGTWRA